MSKSRLKLVLIDGNALLHRGFHALPPLTTSQGELVNAVYGFTLMFLKALEELKPTHAAVCFDRKEKTFRHKLYTDYKGQREAAPKELYRQIPRVKEIIRAFKMPIFSMKGYEADDFIGTISKKCGVPNVIVTGDNDALQLVDADTKVYTLRRGFKDTILYDETKVKNKYDGLTPSQLTDYKGLAGDASDNIPGVKGVGEKTAIKLLKEFGSLEKLYESIKKKDFAKKNAKAKIIKPRILEKLLVSEKSAFLSKKLGTVVTDINLDFKLAEAKIQNYDENEVLKVFRALEFKNLLAKIPSSPQEKTAQQGSLFAKKETAEFSLAEKNQTNKVRYSLLQETSAIKNFLAELEKQPIIALDTETTSLLPLEAKLVGISFCFKEGEASYLHDFLKMPLEVKEKVRAILKNPRIKKIGQNVKYDYLVLKNHGYLVNNLSFDTMVASYLLDATERRHSLDDLAFKELGYKMMSYDELVGTGRERKKITEVPVKKLTFYTCEDVDYTWRLAKIFQAKFSKEPRLKELFFEIEMPLVLVLAHMEEAGIKIEAAKLKKLSVEFGADLKFLARQIYDLAGTKAFNINSTGQLSKILFEKLHLPIRGLKKTQSGISTAASELAKIRFAHPIVALIEQQRELAKLKNTYLDTLPSLINPKTGRVHTSFNQTVTATGRLSSSDPNLQNIPTRTAFGQKIRSAFVAPKGQKLISADYSQIDLRVVASLSGDAAMIQAFKEDQDVHAYTASLVFQKKIETITRKERNFAKTINFGVLYGMSAFSLAQNLGIPREEAQNFIDRYFEKHSGIKKYIENTLIFARQKGYVETLVGRRRYLPELKSKTGPLVRAGERIAVNMPVQGTSADIIKIAMNKIYAAIIKENLPLNMLLQIHDELIFEAPEKQTTSFLKLIQEKMEKAFKLKVPLKVTTGFGANWGELK